MNQSESQGFGFLDLLAIMSFAMQVENYQEIKRQATTDDIYKELQKQDREYLDKLVYSQSEILDRISKIERKLDER